MNVAFYLLPLIVAGVIILKSLRGFTGILRECNVAGRVLAAKPQAGGPPMMVGASDVYHVRIYPQLVRILGNPKPIRDIRQRIVSLAHGTVLEIGVGPGVNFVYYDPARVQKVVAQPLICLIAISCRTLIHVPLA